MTNDYLFGIQSHIQRSSKRHAQRGQNSTKDCWKLRSILWRWKRSMYLNVLKMKEVCSWLYVFKIISMLPIWKRNKDFDIHVFRSSHFSSAVEAFIAQGFSEFQGLWTWTNVKCFNKCHWIMFILSNKLSKYQSCKEIESLISKLSSNFNCKV